MNNQLMPFNDMVQMGKVFAESGMFADAKAAQTKNMDKYPQNMLFARAMSNGVKWYTPDIFAGPVYTPEEMGDIKTEDIGHEVVQPDNKEVTASWINNVAVPEDLQQLNDYWESAPVEVRADKGFIKAVKDRKAALSTPLVTK